MKISDIPKELEEIRKADRFRKVRDLRMITASRGVDREGKEYIVFNSNDYLGMTHEKEVEEAVRNAIAYGTGSGGARLTSGAVFELSDLEKEIAAFKHKEDAVIFNTGYMTNLGVLYALAGPGDVIFSDALNHASIVDGCRISKATVKVYPHSDMKALQKLLHETETAGQRFIVTDGVFSMDGDVADLPSLVRLKDKYKACLIVDDAHATGVIGETGRGTAEYYHMEGIDIQWAPCPNPWAPKGICRCQPSDYRLPPQPLPPLHLLHLHFRCYRRRRSGSPAPAGKKSGNIHGRPPPEHRVYERKAHRSRHPLPSR